MVHEPWATGQGSWGRERRCSGILRGSNSGDALSEFANTPLLLVLTSKLFAFAVRCARGIDHFPLRLR